MEHLFRDSKLPCEKYDPPTTDSRETPNTCSSGTRRPHHGQVLEAPATDPLDEPACKVNATE